MIVFDNVLVPWERVFFYHRQDIAHQLFTKCSFTPQTLHQVVIRQCTKAELFLGLHKKWFQRWIYQNISTYRKK